jgi:hypothetical protein
MTRRSLICYTMKKLTLFGLTFVLLLLNHSLGYSQSKLGIGAFYGTENALSMDIILTNRTQLAIFKVGAALTMGSDKHGEEVIDPLFAYGTTIDGTGDYFFSIDLGYGRIIKEKFTLEGELSLGQKTFYTNYNQLPDVGCHTIDKTEPVVGGGILAGYLLNENLGVNVGYNSIKGLSFGMRLYLHL